MTEEDEPEIPTLTASPDAETTILFTSHPEQGICFAIKQKQRMSSWSIFYFIPNTLKEVPLIMYSTFSFLHLRNCCWEYCRLSCRIYQQR